MSIRTSRTALVALVVASGAAAVVPFACATSGTGAPATFGGDASVDDTGSGQHDAQPTGEGGCVANVQSDPANCGTCGHACAMGQVCSSGSCQTPCSGGLIACQDTCVDITKDDNNCGGCGQECLPPPGGNVPGVAHCVSSACQWTCPADAGATRCDVDAGGGPAGCADLQTSTDHCGSCGTSCSTGQNCVSGHCCMGNAMCGGACVDTTKDPSNCGACDAGCAAPAQCINSMCIGYTTSTPTTAFVDACTFSGAQTVLASTQGWAMSQAITLPFSFPLYGAAQSQVFIGSQGTLGFGPPSLFYAGYPDCTMGATPFTAYAALVAYGNDGLETGSSGICYGTQGTAPNRQFAVTWKGATNSNDPSSVLTFSIVLTETANTIDYLYETASGADGGIDPVVGGEQTTVGIQSNMVTYTTAYFCGTGGKGFIPSTPFAVHFAPAQ